MGRPRFGTDGVRGVANADLTAEVALALGRATARVLQASAFVVGRDTRRSGPLLQGVFGAGLATEGVTVFDAGVLPTPALAFIGRARGVPAAVVSASHNPFGDNGIKLFSAEGTKLPVEVEHAIEKELDALIDSPEHPPARPSGSAVGVIVADTKAADQYRQGVILRSRAAGSTGCTWSSTARTGRPAPSPGRSSNRSAPGSTWCSIGPTASTSTTAAARPTPPPCRRRCSNAAPRSASPSTATPTG